MCPWVHMVNLTCVWQSAKFNHFSLSHSTGSIPGRSKFSRCETYYSDFMQTVPQGHETKTRTGLSTASLDCAECQIKLALIWVDFRSQTAGENSLLVLPYLLCSHKTKIIRQIVAKTAFDIEGSENFHTGYTRLATLTYLLQADSLA